MSPVAVTNPPPAAVLRKANVTVSPADHTSAGAKNSLPSADCQVSPCASYINVYELVPINKSIVLTPP